MKLRKILEKHTVVQLEDADAKLVQDMEQRATEQAADSLLPSASAAAGKSGQGALMVVESSLRSRVRLATVDNFQGTSLHTVRTREWLFYFLNLGRTGR
jgi:hypothetical protein